MTADNKTRWIDPEAIGDLIDHIRNGYESAPALAQAILLSMIGIGVLVVIFRIARSLAARLMGVALAALVTAGLHFYGPDLLDHASFWFR
jgi:hypothetical protein